MKALGCALLTFAFVAGLTACVASVHAATREKFVTVEGAVKNPGRIAFPPERHLTIVEAISLAGGHTGNADLTRVWWFKASPAGDPQKVVIDVTAILRGQAARVRVSPDDRVVLIGRDVNE